MASNEDSGADRAGPEERLDPTIMFGGAGGIPTPAEVVAQTILQMVADGKRATAQKQMERDAPVLATHKPGDGVGMDIEAIIELARETETIPDAFAVPMAQLLRGTYAPEAKMDLVKAVTANREQARAMKDALPTTAPALAKVFSGLIDQALSIRPRTGALPQVVAQGGNRVWIFVGLLLVIAAVAAAYFLTRG